MKRRNFLLGAFGAFAGTEAPASLLEHGASVPGAESLQLAQASPVAGAVAHGVPLFQGRAGSVARSVFAKLADFVSVKDFGAVGDGVADDTAAVQRAIDSFARGRGMIHFPGGIYRVTSTINIAQDRIYLVGEGKQVSIVRFDPKAPAVCFAFGKGAAELFQVGITGFGFDGPSEVQKIAVRGTDTSELTIEDIAVLPWNGAGSIGFQLRGRELTRVRNVTVRADLPVSIEDNPNHTLDLDHSRFTDCYFLPGRTQPCIRVQSGVHLTNVTFDGAQAWVGGSGGFYWNDTTSKASSLDVYFQNVRYEQSANAASYVFYIRANYAVQGLTLRNICLPPDCRGIYMRGCKRVMLDTVTYHGTRNEALNADGSCDQLFLQNCFFQQDSTAVMAGLTETWSPHRFSPRFPVAGTSFWVAGK